MNAVELHGYVGCPFLWRVRLAAAEKGVAAEFLPCDVADPDPRTAAHNPDEHSPLLWHDGFELLESEIIAQYLDEAFEGPSLAAADAQPRAKLRHLSTQLRGVDVHMEPSKPEARRRAQPALQRLEAALAAGNGPFLHGARPGLTDLMAWPFLANQAVRGLLPHARSSPVTAYVEAMIARPSFAETAPPWARPLLARKS